MTEQQITLPTPLTRLEPAISPQVVALPTVITPAPLIADPVPQTGSSLVNPANSEFSPEEIRALRESLGIYSPEDIDDLLKIMIYGEPGSGKTWLVGTALDDPRTRPLCIFDCDGGTRTLKGGAWKGKEVEVIAVRTLEQLKTGFNRLYSSIKNGKLYYKTVAIDTATELANFDMKQVMAAAFNKNPETVNIDVPSPREYGISRNHMLEIMRAFRDLPCNIIITAHLNEKFEENQPSRFLPGFSGKLKNEVPGFMDIVGYYSLDAPNPNTIIRKLQVQGSRRVQAKDRTSSLGGIVTNPTIPMLWDMIQGSGVGKMEVADGADNPMPDSN